MLSTVDAGYAYLLHWCSRFRLHLFQKQLFEKSDLESILDSLLPQVFELGGTDILGQLQVEGTPDAGYVIYFSRSFSPDHPLLFLHLTRCSEQVFLFILQEPVLLVRTKIEYHDTQHQQPSTRRLPTVPATSPTDADDPPVERVTGRLGEDNKILVWDDGDVWRRLDVGEKPAATEIASAKGKMLGRMNSCSVSELKEGRSFFD